MSVKLKGIVSIKNKNENGIIYSSKYRRFFEKGYKSEYFVDSKEEYFMFFGMKKNAKEHEGTFQEQFFYLEKALKNQNKKDVLKKAYKEIKSKIEEDIFFFYMSKNRAVFFADQAFELIMVRDDEIVVPDYIMDGEIIICDFKLNQNDFIIINNENYLTDSFYDGLLEKERLDVDEIYKEGEEKLDLANNDYLYLVLGVEEVSKEEKQKRRVEKKSKKSNGFNKRLVVASVLTIVILFGLIFGLKSIFGKKKEVANNTNTQVVNIEDQEENVDNDINSNNQENDTNVNTNTNTNINNNQSNANTNNYNNTNNNTNTTNTTTNTSSNSTSKQSTYTIQKGDNLYRISLKFYNTGKKVDEIKALNNIQDETKIKVGQEIKLP
ncbi:MAG: LysM peptidoglycan-binding domain-containing protein [Peptostreptococcaceae bacterium]|nr:LysM peptidoglycan-binding domain-containing protein [Peptostreptococcaceae bacterium]